jgi:nicotinamide-nucleotide amidase
MFASPLRDAAAELLCLYRARGLRIATAEGCTGGLVAALLTEIAGSSEVLERGFVAYANAAKGEDLGVSAPLLAAHGAISAPVACAMAEGALDRSRADVAVAVTGIAGPGGNGAAKPVGLVFLALARRGAATLHRECRFGDAGRDAVRLQALHAAIALLREGVGAPP